MKNIKYLLLSAILIGFTACSDDEYDYNPAPEPLPQLNVGTLDFSKYVAVGASFTAGYTDGAVFMAAQKNSFPNILNQQFASVGGGSFAQPMMNDNIGGLLFSGNQIANPRLYFNGVGPVLLDATPTTEVLNGQAGPFNNMGVPGAKSFHFVAPGYGNPQGVPFGKANPYFARMASSPNATILSDAAVQNPTFFTLSEIGGNDVLTYATSGGTGVDQTGNFDPSSYGGNDITDPNVFAQVFSGQVDVLTANGAKGVVTNVPYITSLPHFTTVPYNPLSPALLGGEVNITKLNNDLYGPLKNIFTAYGEADRIQLMQSDAANPLLILDEDATDRSAEIAGALTPVMGPQMAGAFGAIFGKARHATSDDLFVLPLSSAIGTPLAGVPAPINLNGVTYPLEDKWVLTPQEQDAIKKATDLYNTTIENVATAKGLAIVDFKSILLQASTSGISDGDFILTTELVKGGLVSLDGIHLTAKGYAVMANQFLKAIDETYGSNFIKAGVKANVSDFPTNYPPTLQ